MPSAIDTNTVNTNPVATVVPIGRHRRVFPAGAEARHRELGWVLVEQVRDNERLVRWYEFREVPEAELLGRVDDTGEPVIEEVEITAHRQWVSLVDLRRIADPDCSRPEHWQRLKRFGVLSVPIQVIERYVRPAGTPDLPAGVGKGGAT
jgi:hypothetical protein